MAKHKPLRYVERAGDFGWRIRARLRPRLFFAVPIVAIAVFIIAIRYGSFIAGGSDSHCYLSQARLWTTGWPIVQESLIIQTNALGSWTFIPLGYRPGPTFGTFAPICSMGYPLTMATVVRLFGSGTEMYIVPLAAGILVFVTGWMGRRIGGDVVGVLSSLLLATSPIVVFQSLQPMSDAPAACLWSLSAALVMMGRIWALTAAVPVVAMAVLTRPNLAPLTLPLFVFALMAGTDEKRRYNWRAGAAIVAGLVLGAATIAYTNSVLFGAPLSTGYGAPQSLYRLRFFWTNVRRYGAWLFETETFLILLAPAGLARLAFSSVALPRRWAWFASAMLIVVCVSYVFYEPFEDWTYLRFLLPAFPLAFIALTSVMKRPALATMLSVPLLAGHVYFVAKHDVLLTQVGERRYLEVATYVNDVLPSNALLISAQHSGSVSYYTRKKILRFDWLEARNLDNALEQIGALGYEPYILLDEWEEDWFKSRFRRNRLSRLDWQPTAEFNTRPRVRIYDPSEREEQ